MSDGEGGDTVPVGAIAAAPTVQVAPDASDASRDPLTGIRSAVLDQELGILGRFIGGRGEKSGNVAFFVVLISGALLFIIVIAMIAVRNTDAQRGLQTIGASLLAAMTGALGFLFGSGKRS